MATKKSGGASKNNRDSNPKYLGVKKFGGESVISGNILCRQRGTKYRPGFNTHIGKDHTIHANIEGIVYFYRQKGNLYIAVKPFIEAKAS